MEEKKRNGQQELDPEQMEKVTGGCETVPVLINLECNECGTKLDFVCHMGGMINKYYCSKCDKYMNIFG